jgi:hypothetical protein
MVLLSLSSVAVVACLVGLQPFSLEQEQASLNQLHENLVNAEAARNNAYHYSTNMT